MVGFVYLVMGSPSKGCDECGCKRVLRWAPDQVSKLLAGLGQFAARRPWVLICTAVVLVGLGVPGWVTFKIAADPEKSWVPPNSVEAHRRDVVNGFFEEDNIFYQVRL